MKLVEAKDLKDTKRIEALSQRSQDRKENRRGKPNILSRIKTGIRQR